MITKEGLKQRAKEIAGELVSIRRHLHMHPELSYVEYETSKYIAAQLDSLGIPYKIGIAETGTVATIEGKDPSSKVIALRADIDALPIKEANDVPYKSKNEGVMHACGHDVHTTSLLGAARLLNEHKEDFSGTIKLIFQPGEEKLPGGASLMIKEGVLKNPTPTNIIGQHVMPFIPAGKVGFRSGMYMASADEIYVKVKGKGGHAAMPERNIDPVSLTASMIMNLQQIVSRCAPPKIPSVLSFGKVIAEGATNVIPNEVYLEGTFRTMNEEWRALAHKKMQEVARHTVEAFGGSVEFDIRKGYPFLSNAPELSKDMKSAAEEYLGKENVEDLDIWMAAEDFAYYSQEIDACFYRLGTGNDAEGKSHSVHTPNFDIDESALEIGAGLMAWLAIIDLKQA